jgi:hypothetical protein
VIGGDTDPGLEASVSDAKASAQAATLSGVKLARLSPRKLACLPHVKLACKLRRGSSRESSTVSGVKLSDA